jgi:hypothetical protein
VKLSQAFPEGFFKINIRTKMSSFKLASEVAQLLDRDPIMARQLKEHVGENRLLEILEIKPVIEKETVKDELEEMELVAAVVETVPLAKVLEAYRVAGSFAAT